MKKKFNLLKQETIHIFVKKKPMSKMAPIDI